MVDQGSETRYQICVLKSGVSFVRLANNYARNASLKAFHERLGLAFLFPHRKP